MFKFLKNLFKHPAPEGAGSRFGAVKAPPLTPEELAEMRRLEAARDAAWRRAWIKAQQSGQPVIEREGRK